MKSEHTPTTENILNCYVYASEGYDGSLAVPERQSKAEFARWLAEVERAAAEKALTTMADELAALDDGGKRGLAGHSKSSASAITHRHAVAVVRARAAALGLTAGQEEGER